MYDTEIFVESAIATALRCDSFKGAKKFIWANIGIGDRDDFTFPVATAIRRAAEWLASAAATLSDERAEFRRLNVTSLPKRSSLRGPGFPLNMSS